MEKVLLEGGYKAFADGKEIGFVTTDYKLHGQKESIDIILINIEYAKIGKNIQIEVRNKLADAETTSKKFLEKKYKKINIKIRGGINHGKITLHKRSRMDQGRGEHSTYRTD